MRHTLKHAFTMIEIMIALGVTAVGICSIMVLFPIGANANRDAAMETYGANAVDELLHYLKWAATDNKAANWEKLFVNTTTTDSKYRPLPGSYTTAYQAVTYNDKTDWTTPLASSNSIIQHDSTSGLYLLVNARSAIGSTWSSIKPENIEDPAIIYVWKQQVKIDDTRSVDYDYAVSLHAEVSWPATLPYAARKKSNFVFDIFKP